MTRYIRNPINRAENAKQYAISADLFFCLLQLYLDFSKQRAGFDLTIYYELYLQISENKSILSALLTPKENLNQYLDTYSFDYDIADKKQILNENNKLHALSLSTTVEKDHGNFQGLIVPAMMLKKMYQFYQLFIYTNKTGFSLHAHHYHLAFLGDEPLMALEIDPATNHESWMKGELGGLQGYVMCDLKKDLWLDDFILVLPKSKGSMYKENRKQQARINKKHHTLECIKNTK